MTLAPALEHVGTPARPVLVWRLARPMVAISTAVCGGGIGARAWVVNAQVSRDYSRTDLDTHVAELAGALGCSGQGIGMLTAADVVQMTSTTDGGVHVVAPVVILAP